MTLQEPIQAAFMLRTTTATRRVVCPSRYTTSTMHIRRKLISPTAGQSLEPQAELTSNTLSRITEACPSARLLPESKCSPSAPCSTPARFYEFGECHDHQTRNNQIFTGIYGGFATFSGVITQAEIIAVTATGLSAIDTQSMTSARNMP